MLKRVRNHTSSNCKECSIVIEAGYQLFDTELDDFFCSVYCARGSQSSRYEDDNDIYPSHCSPFGIDGDLQEDIWSNY